MELLLGIDFGTTNTVISYYSNNKSILLMDGIFKTIPSKIANINNKYYCGNYIPIVLEENIHANKAIVLEENIHANNIIHSFKLLDDNYDLLHIFFKHIHDLIIKVLKLENPILKAVITVPSNFNDKQRETIKLAFINNNIDVIRIINEPSAAALSYGLNHSSKSEEIILVIDTGGGTMDFTVLEKTDSFFEVIHSCGLNDLGGNNFTQLIIDDIKRQTKLDNINWNIAQTIKEKLTYLDKYDIKINDMIYYLTRIRFENLTCHLIEKIKNTLSQIIKDFSNIDYIILVGGTSKIPILQKTIKEITNKTPWIHPNLESVVSEGAALFAGIITNKFTINNDVLLIDILPLSLGIELADKSFSIIIPKNTPLPYKKTEKYTTDSPHDNSIKIKIFQGERKIAEKNHFIGEIIFDKVSIGCVPIIEITFKVDINSIINITITDRKTGIEKNIVFKNINIDTTNLPLNIESIDDEELLTIQHKYLIKTHIENILINLQVNELIKEETKHDIYNNLKNIEESLDTLSNIELIETLNNIKKNYGLLSEIQPEEVKEKEDYTEQLFIQECKSELENRIKLLLVKNPEYTEYLDPVLEQLKLSNISIDYINDKLSLLNDIEKEDDNEDTYKTQTNHLCLFLKMELEIGNINLGEKNNKLLIDLINTNLLLLDNDDDINWEDQLNIINNKCKEIYNLK